MKKKIHILTLLTILLLLICLKHIFNGQFSSVEDFRQYLDRFGIAGAVILPFFLAFQVVVPVLPGYLGCAAGAVAFGSTVGFICNYIGISAGSIIAYFIARKYGVQVLGLLFSEKQIGKWTKKIRQAKSYDMFLFVATLLPLFPDDFLCYFSGAMKMKPSKFIWIIIIGKPWCILAYSLIFGSIK